MGSPGRAPVVRDILLSEERRFRSPIERGRPLVERELRRGPLCDPELHYLEKPLFPDGSMPPSARRSGAAWTNAFSMSEALQLTSSLVSMDAELGLARGVEGFGTPRAVCGVSLRAEDCALGVRPTSYERSADA
jgi:hypothetical protein